jgi:hypothetical protein
MSDGEGALRLRRESASTATGGSSISTKSGAGSGGGGAGQNAPEVRVAMEHNKYAESRLSDQSGKWNETAVAEFTRKTLFRDVKRFFCEQDYCMGSGVSTIVLDKFDIGSEHQVGSDKWKASREDQWMSMKHHVVKALNQKCNNTVSAIKKGFKGARHVLVVFVVC